MSRLEKVEARFRLLKAEICETVQKEELPSLELVREYEVFRNALLRLGSPSLALAPKEDLEMYQPFCYVCLRCGHIIKRRNYQPENRVHCLLCGYDVQYWSWLELEVEARR